MECSTNAVLLVQRGVTVSGEWGSFKPIWRPQGDSHLCGRRKSRGMCRLWLDRLSRHHKGDPERLPVGALHPLPASGRIGIYTRGVVIGSGLMPHRGPSPSDYTAPGPSGPPRTTLASGILAHAQQEPTSKQIAEWYVASAVTAPLCQTCPVSADHHGS